MVNKELLSNVKTNHGEVIANLSLAQPVLLVFLRHFGCVFCREALKDIAVRRNDLTKKGVKVVFVHMSSNEIAENYFEEYNLKGVDHISDESCRLYDAFGLTKGSFTQLYGLKSWIRGVEAVALNKVKIGIQQIGDGLQMPGVFLIVNNTIKESYIHKSVSDRPDYLQLVNCCVT